MYSMYRVLVPRRRSSGLPATCDRVPHTLARLNGRTDCTDQDDKRWSPEACAGPCCLNDRNCLHSFSFRDAVSPRTCLRTEFLNSLTARLVFFIFAETLQIQPLSASGCLPDSEACRGVWLSVSCACKSWRMTSSSAVFSTGAVPHATVA